MSFGVFRSNCCSDAVLPPAHDDVYPRLYLHPVFNWLRKKSKRKSILHDWQLGDLSGFDMIVNKDSVQYHSEQTKRTIYFSSLLIRGASTSDLTKHEVLASSATTHKEGGGWHLKGKKGHGAEVLICVISVTYKEDLDWAWAFFNSIRPNNANAPHP